jgi:ketosteroid isomerase-like protein
MDRDGILELEARLQQAMLASDVTELDTLLADDLSFVDPTGKIWSKTDDLDAHRFGVQRIDRLDIAEQDVRLYGASAVTVTRAALSGTFGGAPFAGSLRYTRVWSETGAGWRVVAAHCSLIAF